MTSGWKLSALISGIAGRFGILESRFFTDSTGLCWDLLERFRCGLLPSQLGSQRVKQPVNLIHSVAPHCGVQAHLVEIICSDVGGGTTAKQLVDLGFIRRQGIRTRHRGTLPTTQQGRDDADEEGQSKEIQPEHGISLASAAGRASRSCTAADLPPSCRE